MLSRGRDRRALALTSIAVLVALAATSGTTSATRPVADSAAASGSAPAVTFPRLVEPASVTEPSDVPTSPLVRDVAVAQVGSPSDIPSLALAAYQRAESVLATADATCKIPWTLLAAVGRVESDHGRYAGSALDDDGVARPAILGPRLDGDGATARLPDSDAGVLDGDRSFDRAVGPMQFIPSTWSVVGVDADADGERDPQDIDDAALAAGVYLCAGDEDLSTVAGRTGAVHRYNRSDAYVALVLRIMAAYEQSQTLTGAFTTEAVFAFEPGAIPGVLPRPTSPTDDLTPDHGWAPGDEPTDGPSDRPTDGPAPTPSATPSASPSPTPVAPTPVTPTQTPTEPAPTEPAPAPTAAPTPTPTEPPSDEAIAACTELGLVDDPADPADAFDQCVADYELVVEVKDLCAGLGLVDDPARQDDDFDRCVVQHLPARVPGDLF